MDQIISLFQAAIAFGTIIMFGATGEVLTEKSGNLNLGVPGIMYLGGIASLASSFIYEQACSTAGIQPSPVLLVVIPLVCAFLAAALGGLIFSFLTITLRANQNVTGLTLTIFAAGLANLFGGSLNKFAGGVGQIRVAATSNLFRAKILGFIPVPEAVSKFFFSYGFMVYLAIIVAILAQFFYLVGFAYAVTAFKSNKILHFCTRTRNLEYVFVHTYKYYHKHAVFSTLLRKSASSTFI